MRQWSGSAFDRVMACGLFCTKPLLKPMLFYYQLDSWKQILVKLESEFYHFHSRICVWNCRLPNRRPFCPGRHELIGGVVTYGSDTIRWTRIRSQRSLSGKRLTNRTREISRPRNMGLWLSDRFEPDRRLESTAAEASVKFQGHMIRWWH